MRGQKVWDWKAGIGVYGTFRHGESLGKLVAKWFISFHFFKKRLESDMMCLASLFSFSTPGR
jgi:hypothetical protein